MKFPVKKSSVLILCVFIIAGLVLLFFKPTKTQLLIDAIEANDFNAVNTLLADGVDPNGMNTKPHWFWTLLETHAKRPLTIACQQGNLQIIQLLIEQGATAAHIEGTGWSPLREVLFYYQPDDPQIVKLLLENGAEADWEEDTLPVFAAARMTPRVYAPSKESDSVFAGAYDTETARGITEIVDILLNEQSVNITTSTGETLLMIAVKQENIYLVEHLLSSGCDINLKDEKGNTALDFAKENGNTNIITLLEKTGDGSPIS